MPAGATTEQPVTTFPTISAVGAKRRAVGPSSGGFFMQLHVDHIREEWKDATKVISWIVQPFAGRLSLLIFYWRRIAPPKSPAIPLVPAYLRSFAGVSIRR
jgi:membrane protein DedA with SNARE-associated domain